MKIKCPECETTYDVASEIATGDNQVQCARCSTIFNAVPWIEPTPEPASSPKPSEPPAPQPKPEPKPAAGAVFDEAFAALEQAADEMEAFEEAVLEEPESEPKEKPKKENTAAEAEFTGLLTEEEKAFLANFTSPSNNKEPAEKPATKADPLQLSDNDIEWVDTEQGGPALDQSALDDLFDEPASAEMEGGGPALDQSALDDLFDEPASAGMEDGGPALDQSALDDLFDEPASAEPESKPVSDDAAEFESLVVPTDEADPVEKSEEAAATAPLAATEKELPQEPATFDEIELKPLPEPAPIPGTMDKLNALKGKLKLSPTLVGWGSLAASLLLVLTLGVSFRTAITKVIPGMAGIYDAVGLPVNVRGLEFFGLTHQWVEDDGRMRLVVRGEIVNITDESKPVPEVVFAMLDAKGREFFQWTEQTKPDLLLPRARTRFRAQIPAPVDRVRQLQIRFAKR